MSTVNESVYSKEGVYSCFFILCHFHKVQWFEYSVFLNCTNSSDGASWNTMYTNIGI